MTGAPRSTKVVNMSAESNARSHAESFRWWQGNPDLPIELAELRDLAALRDAVNELISDRAVSAHDSGCSWEAIGSQLDISKQAAAKRFSSKSRLF